MKILAVLKDQYETKHCSYCGIKLIPPAVFNRFSYRTGKPLCGFCKDGEDTFDPRSIKNLRFPI